MLKTRICLENFSQISLLVQKSVLNIDTNSTILYIRFVYILIIIFIFASFLYIMFMYVYKIKFLYFFFSSPCSKMERDPSVNGLYKCLPLKKSYPPPYLLPINDTFYLISWCRLQLYFLSILPFKIIFFRIIFWTSDDMAKKL